MGPKPAGGRQRLLLYIASGCWGLIITAGCAAGFPAAGRPQPLAKAEICLREGDWACVHAAAESARHQFRGQPPAYAAYLQALAWVHPSNPGQDLAKAREAFAQIVQSEPESSMGLASLSWLAVIDALQQQESETRQLRQATKSLSEELSELRTRSMIIQQRLDQMKAVDLSVE